MNYVAWRERNGRSINSCGYRFCVSSKSSKHRLVDDVVAKLSEEDEAAIADEFVMTADDASANLAEMLNMADDGIINSQMRKPEWSSGFLFYENG